MSKLIAFHGQQSIKDSFIAQLEADYVETYDDRFKYEKELGIPIILAHLKELISKRFPNELKKEWQLKFMHNIAVGADLSEVWPKFIVLWLTGDPYGIIQYQENKAVIQFCSNIYSSNLSNEVEREKIWKIFFYPLADSIILDKWCFDYIEAYFRIMKGINMEEYSKIMKNANIQAEEERIRILQSETLLQLLSECKGEKI